MKNKIFKPDILSNQESCLRKLEAEADQRQYVSFPSLELAQKDQEGVVILEGDEGGQIYVVCPASLVKCGESHLQQLLRDIDAVAWKDPSSAHLYYERLPVGSRVSGGKGGGVVQNSIWLHPELEELGLFEGVKAVIEGRRARLKNVH